MTKLHHTLYFTIILSFVSCMYSEGKSVATISLQRNIKKTTPNIQTPPVNAAHNFSNLYQYILKPKCVSCHSGEEPDDDIDLTTYNNLLNHPYYYLVVPGAPDESSIYLSIIADDMPSDAPPLTTQEKNFIQEWIKRGAPQK
jgi:hypothetical protein